MNLAQIRHFLVLAETLSFTRASEICHVTQPALTKSIRKLEEELGGPLLLRERNNSQLTDLGRTMVPLLRRTLDAAEAVRQSASAFRAEGRSRLRLGLGTIVPPSTVTPLIQALRPKFPRLELVVREGRTKALSAWLDDGELDVVFTTDVGRLTPRANTWKLFVDDMTVLTRRGDLAGEAGPSAASPIARPEVAIARWSAEDDGPTAALSGPSEAGARHLAETEEQMWALVRAGCGPALSTLRRAVPPDIACRPLHPPQAIDVHLAMVPGRRADQAVEALIRLARARDWTLVA